MPFEPKLIDFGLMSVKQIEWLNTYNELIVNKVRLERVKGVMKTLRLLLGKTRTYFSQFLMVLIY